MSTFSLRELATEETRKKRNRNQKRERERKGERGK